MASPRIGHEELKQRLDAGASIVLVDARLKYPYDHSTLQLPGAIRVPPDAPLPSIPAGSEVVVYDSDPNELASSQLVARFIREGVKATALRGGIVAWLSANLPVETKDAPRQSTPAPGALKS